MLDQSPLKTYPTLGPAGEASLDLNTSYAQILRLVEGPAKIVDFGCGPGNLARLLSQRECTVVGVDINPEHASIAREYCKDVLVADLEEASLLKLFPSERFDVAIFADILEHLRDPDRLLAEVHRILAPGGVVLASIPNIAHGSIRLSLLQGDFDYQPLGLLDDTHIKFFTKKNALAMFERNGFIVDAVARTVARLFDPSCGLVPHVERADFSDDIISRISEDPEVETLQFILRAVPANSAEARYAASRQIITSLEERVATLSRELADARAQVVPDPSLPSLAHYEEVLARLHVATSAADEAQMALEQTNARLADALKERDDASAARAALNQEMVVVKNAAAEERLAAQAGISNAQARIESLADELTSARSAMKRARIRIRELAEERSAERASMGNAQARIESLAGELTSAHSAMKRARIRIRDLSVERDELTEALGAAALREKQLHAEVARITAGFDALRNDMAAELRLLGDAAAQSSLELSLREAELRKAEEISNYAREALTERQQRVEHLEKMLAQQITQVTTLERQRGGLEKQLAQAKAGESALAEVRTLYEAADLHRAELSAALESLRQEHLALTAQSQEAARAAASERAALNAAVESASKKNAIQEEALADHARHLAEVATRLHMAINSAVEKDRQIEALATRDADLEHVILEMRHSKFWAARNAWFALKGFYSGRSGPA